MIAAGAPAWGVWLALGLWAAALVALAVAAVLVRRVVRRLGPMLSSLSLLATLTDTPADVLHVDEPAEGARERIGEYTDG